MKRALLPAIIISLFLLGGCCSNTDKQIEQPAQTASTATETEQLSDKEKLHNKAKLAEAATLIGYDGKQIRQNLDKIIDANDEHNKMLKSIDGL